MRKLCSPAVALLLTAGVHAAPPGGVNPDSPLAQWYRSLKAPDIGGSCCSIADCRPVDEVLTKRGWLPVLPQRVLHLENLDGRPIACEILGEIRCFVPLDMIGRG